MKNILFHFLLISSLYCIHIDRKEDLEKCIALANKSEFSAVGWVHTKNHCFTGTLIHPRVVVTSAHLLKNPEELRFNIYIFNKFFCVSGRAVIHPTYLTMKEENNLTEENLTSEVALIILDEPLYGVNYLKLPTHSQKETKAMYAIGFGKWNHQSSEYISQSKLGCTVYIEHYTGLLMGASSLNNKYFPLSGHPTNNEDFGCPLISADGNYTLQGIFKNHIIQKEDSYSFYIDLFPHVKWIESTIKQSLQEK